VLVSASSACDLTAPTERFYDSDPRPVEVRTLDVRGLRPGQYVAGRRFLQPDLTAVTDPIQRVVLLVDTVEVFASTTPPYVLELDTERWPDGPHVVTAGVFVSGGAGGLAAAAGVPHVLYTASVVFDQTPPTPTVVDSVVWRDSHPTLYWRRNQDRNFYAYVIDHRGNYAEPFITNLGIDSVFDPATLTYTDTSITPLYGLRLDYYAWVTNRGATATGTPARIQFGDTIAATWNTTIPGIYNTATNEAYVLEQFPSDTLKAISGRTVTRRLAFGYPFPAAMALSQDQAALYVFFYNTYQVTTLDAATFTVMNDYNLAAFSSRAPVAGRAGRLYVGNFARSVSVVDAATGAELGRAPIDVPNPVLAISPDRNTLYVLDTYAGGSFIPVVYRIDVSTDTLTVLSQRTVDDPRTDVTELQVSPDGSRLFLTFSPFSNYVNVWDAATLATVGQLTPPGALFDFVVGPDALYLAHVRDDPRALSRGGRVVRYDPVTLAAGQHWDFVEVPQGIVPSGDAGTLYAFGSFATWIVPLR